MKSVRKDMNEMKSRYCQLISRRVSDLMSIFKKKKNASEKPWDGNQIAKVASVSLGRWDV